MSNQQKIAEPQKLDATVFIYRHKQTGKTEAHYIDIAKILEDDDWFEHIATVDPRMWIEYHYDFVEQRDQLLAAILEISQVACDMSPENNIADAAIARVKGCAA